ncbi:MAG TPA: hypothetical protein VMW63_06410 [Methanoregulaceae archaeon]|nr:hypothetical protein [Methanoregulaceae archaeon]
MKKIIILIIAVIFLTGFAMADQGIDPVPETQGIATSTSVNIVGNFASATELQWRITDAVNGLPGIPPLNWLESTIYESTYTEDTQSSGVGLMLYDKELDVETSGQISGQWNIEATKQIAFIGSDGASVVSSDNIMIDGASTAYFTTDQVICPFAPTATLGIPFYCNRAEAGSTIDMTVANVQTTSTDRFVMPSADHPVELNHDLRVTELVTDVPSVGMASAYMDILIQESGRGYPITLPENVLSERIEFTEETSVDGTITLIDKLMHYESGMVR